MPYVATYVLCSRWLSVKVRDLGCCQVRVRACRGRWGAGRARFVCLRKTDLPPTHSTHRNSKLGGVTNQRMEASAVLAGVTLATTTIISVSAGRPRRWRPHLDGYNRLNACLLIRGRGEDSVLPKREKKSWSAHQRSNKSGKMIS